MQTVSWTFRHSDGVLTMVSAATEMEARRLVMCNRWGRSSDTVCPHAPHYRGDGLTLVA